MTDGTQPSYPPGQLLDQYTMGFEGIMLGCILYGIYVIIAGTSVPLLRKKRSKIFLSFTIAQLVITTLYLAISLYRGPAQLLAIFRLYSADEPNAVSSWDILAVNTVFLVNTLVSDGFVLYRCYVVCKSNKFAVALPTLAYLVTVGASIAWLVVDSTPGTVYSTLSVHVAGTAAFSCSVAMIITTSVVISVRLLLYRRAISQAVGSQQGQFYLSYMAMTLESAMLYTTFAILTLVLYRINSPLFDVFFPVLGIVQVISPSLIVYRIARGFSIKTDGQGNTTIGMLQFASEPLPLHARAGTQNASDTSKIVQVALGHSTELGLESPKTSPHELERDPVWTSSSPQAHATTTKVGATL